MRFIGVLLGIGVIAISGHGEDDAVAKRKAYLYLSGRYVFEQNCSQCHGRLGKGDGEWATDWTVNRPRNFRTGIFKFRSTPMGKLPTNADLRRTITKGISGTAMPAFGSHLREEEYEAVIEYLKHLSKRWKDPENLAKPLEFKERPDWLRKTGVSPQEHVAAGLALYQTHCISCHGEKGKGNGVAAVGLMDVWGHRIAPADFTQKHLKSGPDLEDIYRTIATGLDGTPMVGFHSVLKEEQIWDLVAYIQTLKEKS